MIVKLFQTPLILWIPPFHRKCGRTIQYIGYWVFAECSSLEALHIPPTVTSIFGSAVKDCASLRIINIPDSIQAIHREDIIGCDKLRRHSHERGVDHDEAYRMTPTGLGIGTILSTTSAVCCDPSVTVHTIQQYIQQHHDNDETRGKN